MTMTGHKGAVFSEHISRRVCGFSFFFSFSNQRLLEVCQILSLFCARRELEDGVSTCLPVIQDSDRETSVIKAFLMLLSHKWMSRR